MIFFSTPMSAAAAFQYHWPFGDELCVAYAMIMSTAGCAFLFISILNPNAIRVNNHIFHIGVNIWGYWNLKKKKRNRIDHNIDGVGVVAMSTCRLLSGQTERSFRKSSQQRQWRRQQRQTGPSSGHNFIDSHLDLFVGRHLSAAFRMGTLRSVVLRSDAAHIRLYNSFLGLEKVFPYIQSYSNIFFKNSCSVNLESKMDINQS